MRVAGATGAARDAAADQLAAATSHAIQLATTAGAQALTEGGPPTPEDLSVVRDRFIAEMPTLLGLLAGAWALGGAGIRLAVGAAIGAEVEAGLRALVAAGWTPPPPAADLAAAYLRAARNRLVNISDTVWADVRTELLAGMAAGETPDQLAARVRTAAQVPLGRALNIARTEALGAASAGELAQVLALGVGGTKHWLSAHDARVRPTHVDADGQDRPLAEPFLVGGWPMQRPHDPAGPPEETINCRCTLTYTLGPGEGEGEEEKESLAQTFIDAFSEEAANKILELLLGGSEEGATSEAAGAAAEAAQELLGSATGWEVFHPGHANQKVHGRRYGPIVTDAINEDGGITIHKGDGWQPSKGMALSPYPEREVAIPHDQLTGQAVRDFMAKNQALLRRPDHFLGGWLDPESGKVYLDVSVVAKDKRTADKAAKKYDQLAYFDLASGETHRVAA